MQEEKMTYIDLPSKASVEFWAEEVLDKKLEGLLLNITRIEQRLLVLESEVKIIMDRKVSK